MNGTLVEALRSANRVHFDSMVFIYFIEKNPRYLSDEKSVFRLVQEGRIEAVSSILSLLEVLVKPYRDGDVDLAREYRDLFNHADHLRLIQVDEHVVEMGARIRATCPGIRTPDAIQLSTAVLSGADVFLANDARLKQFREIHVLYLDEFCPDLNH